MGTAAAPELELDDVRQTLAYSTQLSNIGRRLGLGAVDPWPDRTRMWPRRPLCL